MTHQKQITSRAWGELLLLALIWGGSFFSIAIALREIGFFTTVAHRVFWAAVLLWVFVWIKRQPLPRGWGIWSAFLVMGLLNNVLPFSLMAWGQLHIESGLTAILNAATAIFGALFAALFFADEKLTPRKLAGIGFGFSGVILIIGWHALMEFNLQSLGQLAVIAGTISYACAAVWARKTLTGLAPSVAAAGMLTGSSLIMIPLAIAIEGIPSLALAPQTIAAIGYFAIIATAFAYLLYYRVLAMAGSANLMLVTLLIPPTAILLGALFLDESLSQSTYAGFALIAVGLIILDGRIFKLRNAISV